MNKPIRHGSGGPSGPKIHNITYQSEDVVEFNLGICEGPIAGLIKGPRTFFLGETPLMSKSGGTNFSPFQMHLFHGDDNASVVKNALGGISGNNAVGVDLEYDVAVTRQSPASARNVTDSLEVRLYIRNLQRTNDKGDQLRWETDIRIEYRQVGDPSWILFNDEKIEGRIQGAVKEYRWDVPRTSNDWEIRVTKLGPDPGENRFEEVTWESFQTVSKESRSYDNLALIRGLSSASDQLRSIPTFSGVFAGMIVKIPSNYDPVTRYYSGVWDGTFKDAYTDNPAWCLYNLLTNTKYGAKAYYPDLQVDRFSFYEAAQWCDELVPRAAGGFQPRYTYNDRIHEARDGKLLIHYIASTFGGALVEDVSGMMILKVDKPGTPKQIFGPESISEEGFNYQYTDITQRPNDMTVTFKNPNLNWKTDRRRVKLQSFIDKNGRNTQDFIAVGCNDPYEAQRRAHLRLLSANTETLSVSFKAPQQTLLLEPYDIIGLVDPDQNWGLSGRIKSTTDTVVYLRDPLLVPTNTDLTLSVTTPTGVHTVTVQSSVANTTELTITAGSLPEDLPGRAHFSLVDDGSSLGLVKNFRVLTINEDDNLSGVAVVTALEVNPNKHSDADNLTMTTEPVTESTVEDLFENLVVASGTSNMIVRDDGSVESRIFVGWELTQEAEVEVKYRRYGREDFSTIIPSRGEVYLPDVQDGDIYEIVLRGRLAPDQSWISLAPIFHVVTGLDVLESGVVNSLGVGGTSGKTTFEGLDVKLTWENKFPGVVDPTPDNQGSSLYSHNIVTVRDTATSTLLRTLRVSSEDLTYTYQENLEDSLAAGFTSAQRDLTFEVTMYSVSGAASDPVSLAVSNPLPTAVVPQVSANSNTISISAPQGVDTDLAGIKVWIEETPGFDETLKTPKFEGPGSYAAWAGAFDTDYYVKVAYRDLFDDTYVVSSEVSVTTEAATITADNWDFSSGDAGWTLDSHTILTHDDYSAGKALELTSNKTAEWGTMIPINRDRVYKVKIKIKATGAGGDSRIYCGVKTFDSSGTLETATPGAHRYCAAQNEYVPADGAFHIYEGIITGGGNTTHNEFRPTTAFALPMLFANYMQDATFTVEVDELSIEDITEVYAETTIRENSVSGINDKLSASITMRAKAGTNGAELELVAADDPSGSVSLARIAATEIVLDGSVTAAKIDTNDFSAAGLSVFGGDLKSSNFSTGVSGWRITSAGDAEFNSLINRQALIDGAASDGGDQIAYASGVRLHRWDEITRMATGPITPGQLFNIGVRSEYKIYDKRYVSGKTSGWTYYRGWFIAQIRTKSAGIWSSWSTEFTSPKTTSLTWISADHLFSKMGDYEDMEIRLVYMSDVTTDTNYDIGDNVRNATIHARALER